MSKTFLSKLVHYRTYAKYRPEDQRRESKEETIERNIQMNVERFPRHADAIRTAYNQVFEGRAVPSMRSMQFSMDGILRRNNRAFNCFSIALTSLRCFADVFYQSMSGGGVGYSVRAIHIGQLPQVALGSPVPAKLIPDSAEGWADSVLDLLENPLLHFDYSLIRPMGSPLSSGGTASGPKALVKLHANMRHLLKKTVGRKLTAFEAHRLCCFIADCVVCGGVRRSAMIALFDPDDTEMLNCKAGNGWREKYPELERANNSAVVHKSDPLAQEKAAVIIDACFLGGQAEPGLIWTNSDEYIVNPCAEISILASGGCCNLSEVNAAQCFSQADWFKAVEAATIIGTLQASYTDFQYVQPQWKINADAEALLGVSITGQAENQAILTEENLQRGAALAIETNRSWAAKIGINPAKRICTTKPSGSASSWLGTTAGVHAGHEVRYLRRVQLEKESKLGRSLQRHFTPFIVDAPYNENDCIIQIPIRMHDTTLLRSQETALQLLDRMKKLYHNWIVPGHLSGPNTHNVSMTVSYHRHEEEAIKQWMLANVDSYLGISLIPYSGGDYKYLPYSAAPHPEVFDILEKSFEACAVDYDFNSVKEVRDFTNLSGEAACSGGACLL